MATCEIFNTTAIAAKLVVCVLTSLDKKSGDIGTLLENYLLARSPHSGHIMRLIEGLEAELITEKEAPYDFSEMHELGQAKSRLIHDIAACFGLECTSILL